MVKARFEKQAIINQSQSVEYLYYIGSALYVTSAAFQMSALYYIYSAIIAIQPGGGNSFTLRNYTSASEAVQQCFHGHFSDINYPYSYSVSGTPHDFEIILSSPDVVGYGRGYVPGACLDQKDGEWMKGSNIGAIYLGPQLYISGMYGSASSPVSDELIYNVTHTTQSCLMQSTGYRWAITVHTGLRIGLQGDCSNRRCRDSAHYNTDYNALSTITIRAVQFEPLNDTIMVDYSSIDSVLYQMATANFELQNWEGTDLFETNELQFWDVAYVNTLASCGNGLVISHSSGEHIHEDRYFGILDNTSIPDCDVHKYTRKFKIDNPMHGKDTYMQHRNTIIQFLFYEVTTGRVTALNYRKPYSVPVKTSESQFAKGYRPMPNIVNWQPDHYYFKQFSRPTPKADTVLMQVRYFTLDDNNQLVGTGMNFQSFPYVSTIHNPSPEYSSVVKAFWGSERNNYVRYPQVDRVWKRLNLKAKPHAPMEQPQNCYMTEHPFDTGKVVQYPYVQASCNRYHNESPIELGGEHTNFLRNHYVAMVIDPELAYTGYDFLLFNRPYSNKMTWGPCQNSYELNNTGLAPSLAFYNPIAPYAGSLSYPSQTLKSNFVQRVPAKTPSISSTIQQIFDDTKSVLEEAWIHFEEAEAVIDAILGIPGQIKDFAGNLSNFWGKFTDVLDVLFQAADAVVV
jgi:hypothetical protein